MARPERFELPTAWFVVFRLKSHISLYYIAFMRLALSNKIGLFGLIYLYLGLFEAIYWTVKSEGRTTRKGIGHTTFPGFQLSSQMQQNLPFTSGYLYFQEGQNTSFQEK
jgi:hypothetical protein